MPTLGTQTISSSFAQLLKTFTTGGLSGALQVVTDGDDTSSALSLSTTGVSSTGSFSVTGDTTLTGAVTFGSNITASTGTATIGTLSVGTQSVGTSSVNTSTIGTLSVTGRTTTGTLRLGATGPSIIQASFGSGAVTAATLGTMTAANSNSTGTFAMSGLVAGDIIIGQTNLTTSGGYPIASFSVVSNDVARYNLYNSTTTLSTITAGTVSALALRTTA
jgi:hypothetical protein